MPNIIFKCYELSCDELASHPGGVERHVLLVNASNMLWKFA